MTLGAAELLGNGVTTTCEQYRHPDRRGRGRCSTRASGPLYTAAIFDVAGAGPDGALGGAAGEACGLFDDMDGREGRLARRLRPARRLHRAARGAARHRRRGAATRRAAPDPPVRDRGRVRGRARALRHERAGAAGRLGVLDGRVLAAHAVWLDDDDLALLAEHDVAVAHCPGSNGKLGSGVAPLAALLRRGVRVGLGTDGPASNDDLHLWDEMRLAALLARATAGDPDVVSSAAALRLATRGGAEALGLPVGALEVGRPADVIRLRTDDPRFTPALDRRRAARAPGVGGRRLSGDRRLGGRRRRGRGRPLHRSVDEERARAEVAQRARRLLGLVSFLAMPGFVDQAQLHARAGDGGAGAVSWRREAHVDRGGPDGGDGGHGGDVWLVASVNESSLLGFRDHPFRRATDGVHGSGSKRHGARGKDLVVPVPVGTVVRAPRRRRSCATWTGEGSRFLVAEGGQGGRGNARFLSNRRRAPAFAEQGEKGQELWLDMELKLMADVALVGFPNAGKSTLISTVSAAKPKIADYPFTTLEPHLGVVRVGGVRDGTEFVMADIPGLVEGAAGGKGLGHQFLRHIERARVLVVLLDLAAPELAGEAPADQLRVLLSELGAYRPELLERPRVVVGSKGDVAADDGGRVRPHALGRHRRRRRRAVDPPGGAGGRGAGTGGRRGLERDRRAPARARRGRRAAGRRRRLAGRGPGRRARRGLLGPHRRRRAGRGRAPAAPPRRRPRPVAGGRPRRRRSHGGRHDLHLGGGRVIAVVKIGSSSVTPETVGPAVPGDRRGRGRRATPSSSSPRAPSPPGGPRSAGASSARPTPPSSRRCRPSASTA